MLQEAGPRSTLAERPACNETAGALGRQPAAAVPRVAVAVGLGGAGVGVGRGGVAVGSGVLVGMEVGVSVGVAVGELVGAGPVWTTGVGLRSRAAGEEVGRMGGWAGGVGAWAGGLSAQPTTNTRHRTRTRTGPTQARLALGEGSWTRRCWPERGEGLKI